MHASAADPAGRRMGYGDSAIPAAVRPCPAEVSGQHCGLLVTERDRTGVAKGGVELFDGRGSLPVPNFRLAGIAGLEREADHRHARRDGDVGGIRTQTHREDAADSDGPNVSGNALLELLDGGV